MSDDRPDMNHVLLDMATLMSTRSTCERGHVGAVLARDGRIISTGYNGAPAGMPHCVHNIFVEDLARDHEGRSFYAGCPDSVHAEANAIAFAARNGVPTAGSVMYSTHTPCVKCAQLIINAGIVKLYAIKRYRDDSGMILLVQANISVQDKDGMDWAWPGFGGEVHVAR